MIDDQLQIASHYYVSIIDSIQGYFYAPSAMKFPDFQVEQYQKFQQ